MTKATSDPLDPSEEPPILELTAFLDSCQSAGAAKLAGSSEDTAGNTASLGRS